MPYFWAGGNTNAIAVQCQFFITVTKKHSTQRHKKTRRFYAPGSLVGNTGFEPVTPALSRRCSKPTELIARGRQMYEQTQKCRITQNQSCESLLEIYL